ncbi:MAG: putative metal-binding motif-containing protein [Alphaproteobacteria bacterium]|nr:putative metal-binding motif-containing protein [Alphaproteobacteria bacterium]
MRTPLFTAAAALSLLVGCLQFKDDAAVTDDTGVVGDPTVDGDGDGFYPPQDCDDEDETINPAADEVPYDGVDNDCDSGTPDDDLDGDGFPAAEDCDDEDASVNPEDGCVGGTYSGPITVTVNAFGFGDSCEGNLFVDVSDRATPQVSGDGTCTYIDFFSFLGAQDIVIGGTLGNNGAVSGDVEVGLLAADTWTGTVTASRLTGSFSGSTDLSGIVVDYSGEFTLNLR